MSGLSSKIREVYSLEQLSSGNTLIHKLNPLCKIIGTLLFIIFVVSFPPYEVSAIVPYVLYIVFIMIIGDIPFGLMLKRTAIAMPFCLFAGLSNLIFNTTPAFTIGGFTASYGLLSFCSIMIRTPLCVSAVLIMVATTPVTEIANQLRRVRIPNIFVSLFEMTYRYISTILTEADNMFTAYSLRSGGKKAIDLKDMGSFVGQLLIRSADRAERVYSAMKCRGYGKINFNAEKNKFRKKDIVFLSVVTLCCLVFRLVNIPQFLGGLF